MSTKRTAKSKKGEKGTEVKEALSKPTARVPQATVMVRHDHEMKARLGRGFSLGEIERAILPQRLAVAWGVSVDPRRGTVLEGNVDSLKKWYAPPKPKVVAPEPVPEQKSKTTAKKRQTRKKKED